MSSDYGILLQKINEFIRKYYLNAIIRGSLYAAGSLIALFLIAFLISYFLQPEIKVKTIMFFSYLGLSGILFSYWILKPLLAFLKIGPSLSVKEAAIIIGKHFKQIEDKLLNAIQLQELSKLQPENQHLILAGINQKIENLSPIPFNKAIKLRDNKKYLKFLLIPLAAILCISFISPRVFKEGSQNFLQYEVELIREAPFHYKILNETLNSAQGADYLLQVAVSGNEIPNEVYLEDSGFTYALEKTGKNTFQFQFKQLQKSKSFRLKGGGYISSSYNLTVFPKPDLISIKALINYPTYTKRAPELIKDLNNLQVPEGSQLSLEVQLNHTDKLYFKDNQSHQEFTIKGNQWKSQKKLLHNYSFNLYLQNKHVAKADSLHYEIIVVKDEYPNITLIETPDSISLKNLYLSGQISDDYGFSALNLKYEILDKGKVTDSRTIALKTPNESVNGSFFYWLSLDKIALNAGQTLQYYFEVKDNDAVNGPKSTRSAIKTYSLPTSAESNKVLANQADEIQKKIQESIKLNQQLEKEAKHLNQQITQKTQLSFEEQKEIQQYLAQQKKLEEMLKEIAQLQEAQKIQREELNPLSPNQKKEALNELFQKTLDPQTQDLIQKLEQLLKQQEPNQTRSELNKLQNENKAGKKELERLLALYKQIEFEAQLEAHINELQNLAQRQAQESQTKNPKANDAAIAQQQLQAEFQTWQKELNKLAEKGKQLQQEQHLDKQEEIQILIQSLQQSAQNQLQKTQIQAAQANQKKASEAMKALADKLRQDQEQAESQAIDIQIEDLKKVLKNTLKASFDQESNMLAIRKTQINDPDFTRLVKSQRLLLESFGVTADSLFSTAKKVPQLAQTVNTEMNRIQNNLDQAINLLAERRSAEAGKYQQAALTALNNLAVLINESLNQLQQSKSGGKGKSKQQSLGDLQQNQAALNKQMEQAKQQLQKEGKAGQANKGQMSKEFADMAKQQQLLREALQKLNAEQNKDGSNPLGNLNELVNDLKKTEADLVNKRINEETLKRQTQVEIKLLEAEKAMREQAEDDTRKSNSGKNIPPGYIKALEKYEQEKKLLLQRETQLPPNLSPYYRAKIAEYLKKLNQ